MPSNERPPATWAALPRPQREPSPVTITAYWLRADARDALDEIEPTLPADCRLVEAMRSRLPPASGEGLCLLDLSSPAAAQPGVDGFCQSLRDTNHLLLGILPRARTSGEPAASTDLVDLVVPRPIQVTRLSYLLGSLVALLRCEINLRAELKLSHLATEGYRHLVLNILGEYALTPTGNEKSSNRTTGRYPLSENLARLQHRINTPLTNVLGYAGLLDDEKLSPDDRAEFLRTMIAELRRLSASIQELLGDAGTR